MRRLMLFAAGLLIVAACTDAVTNPDKELVPGPQFAKWTASYAGCDNRGLTAVKFQLQGDGLKVTGTSGDDDLDCQDVLVPITFQGGDGDDIFQGGSGDDQLVGGNGDDLLSGSVGDDHINGGLGFDSCFGEFLTGCEPAGDA